MSDELPLVAPDEEVGLPAPAMPAGEVTLLTIIDRAARDPSTDVDKLERLMALYERHQAGEKQAAYTAALAEMQPELPEIEEHGAITDRQGEVQSTYALWEDVQKKIKPILAKHGFALNFEVAREDQQIAVTAILSHRAGHSQRTTLPLPLDTSGSKNTVQAYGSSTSYGMRYTARALLNLTSRGGDDDGVAGGTKLISASQLEVLRTTAETQKINVEKLCNFLKVPSLDQLPARRFQSAHQALLDYIARREAERARNPKHGTGKPRVASGASGAADSE